MPVGKRAKLLEARNECYKKDEKESIDIPKEISDYEFEKEKNKLYDEETLLIIKETLVNFTDENCLPLCEFLEIDYINQFMRFLHSSCSLNDLPNFL